ncbi:hypothetical protein SNE26_17720 [Mucilaginibacter sp. cycad4]|uniref:hypothetical protein n=1 Tax=Mucilaginibacter sp. cycad4 TaxID=3342096 RepID=UPI002AAC1D99|nr:hypothetical protein [Mucilaginibacter gossypii]WPU97868.1 hypothetical protein SNE26_17720 [Mucilaginibacter gossypii]
MKQLISYFKRNKLIEKSQFEELRSEIELIQTNTSWIWNNNTELEKLNEKMEVILTILDENTGLLRELISVIKNQANQETN